MRRLPVDSRAELSPATRATQQLTGARVEDLGPLAEVDLRGLAGIELQHGGHLWVGGLEGCEEAGAPRSTSR